ncbi:hypothetical protein GGX14DRAFT_390527 [Mycena pura]|uniref:Uncharacterized protein n=1 Tax=Mycena pura TaxID=153505 RepID=A0AAD6YHG7_9AGAR|nr:hypothetical protein GGX14DRAFT_390527 [Mycena pura]
MQTAIQLFYTSQFPPASCSLLESILSAAFAGIRFETNHDPALHGLSPSKLFKHRSYSFSQQQYALIADSRTLSELHAHVSPTVLVVSARSITPMDQWRVYDGPGDLSPLTPLVRLALLRAMVEERFALDQHTEEWFWNPDDQRWDYNAKLWQIKALRADPAGANYACVAYSVKDKDKQRHVDKFETCGSRFCKTQLLRDGFWPLGCALSTSERASSESIVTPPSGPCLVMPRRIEPLVPALAHIIEFTITEILGLAVKARGNASSRHGNVTCDPLSPFVACDKA